ncbi:hypothetical protein Bbelb_419550 [Branchiostoma belcheri]|nr:hypothetical protein Bbelb_419550 [Branchiostoma belcheri]
MLTGCLCISSSWTRFRHLRCQGHRSQLASPAEPFLARTRVSDDRDVPPLMTHVPATALAALPVQPGCWGGRELSAPPGLPVTGAGSHAQILPLRATHGSDSYGPGSACCKSHNNRTSDDRD